MHASLTSREALDALIDLRTTDRAFYDEISSGRAEEIGTGVAFEEDDTPAIEELQSMAADDVESDDEDALTDMEEESVGSLTDGDGDDEMASAPSISAAAAPSTRPSRSTMSKRVPIRFREAHTGSAGWEEDT